LELVSHAQRIKVQGERNKTKQTLAGSSGRSVMPDKRAQLLSVRLWCCQFVIPAVCHLIYGVIVCYVSYTRSLSERKIALPCGKLAVQL
jgi:hypothetical protein